MKKIFLLLFSLTFLLNVNTISASSVRDIKSRLGVNKPSKKKTDSSKIKGFKQVIGKYYIIQVKDISRQEAERVLKYVENLIKELVNIYEYPFSAQKCFIKIFGKKKDFEQVARSRGLDNVSGFYYSSGVSNYVVTYNSSKLYSTLSHEVTHQFIEKVFKKEPPAWFSEGLASYYATSKYVDNNFISNQMDRNYLFKIKDAISKKKLPKIKNLIVLDHEDFYERNKFINYAASWSLVYYLKNKDNKKFKMFVNDLKLGKSFSSCIRSSYGIKLKEFEKDWKEYIKNLVSN